MAPCPRDELVLSLMEQDVDEIIHGYNRYEQGFFTSCPLDCTNIKQEEEEGPMRPRNNLRKLK